VARGTADYVQLRLRRAGADRDIFTADALTLLHEAAGSSARGGRRSGRPRDHEAVSRDTIDHAVEHALRVGPAARLLVDADPAVHAAATMAAREALAARAGTRGVWLDGPASACKGLRGSGAADRLLMAGQGLPVFQPPSHRGPAPESSPPFAPFALHGVDPYDGDAWIARA
jgi:hypothetical protein